jgi:multidrug efflux pump subunit AcrB
MTRSSLKTIFYDNPRLLLLAVALVVVAGFSSWQILPRMEDPELTSRNAVIFARYPGADSERVEALLVEPIEDELRELEEIKEIRSTASAGIATVQIELLDEIHDVDQAWSLVRDRLSDVRPSFPQGALDPELREFHIAARTLITAITWEAASEPEPALLSRIAETLEQELRAVPGTMDTKVYGAADEEILVEVDPAKLAALSLTAGQVSRQVAESDAKLSSGTWRGDGQELQIELQGELDSVERVASVPLRRGERGRILRLGDIAEVRKTIQDPPAEVASIYGKPGVAIAARMQSGRRVDQWSSDARAVIASFNERLPEGLALHTLFDQSRYTEARLDSLFGNLWMGAGLVMLVVLLFMGWRSALLVGTALPLSVLSVFAGMRFLGIPLHQMSVAGLIIALGLLIDNAIVMVDEMRRHLDEDLGPREALSRSLSRLAVPLFGSSLTTALAFMPLVLAPGGVGEFVGAMSVSVILAILSSFMLALTVVPAMAALLDRFTKTSQVREVKRPGRLSEMWNSALQTLLARPALAVLFALTLPAAGFVLGSTLDEQFFPPADRDMLQIELELPQGASIAETLEGTRELRELLLQDPKVEAVHWFAGASGPKFYYNQIEGRENAPHYAGAIVQLADAEGLDPWMRSTQASLDDALPSARILIKLLEQGPPVDAPVELRLQGTDLEVLASVGQEVRRELAASNGVVHTTASMEGAQPQLGLELDESEVRLVGLTRGDVARQLQAALEGSLGGSLIEDTEELPVRVRLSSDTRAELDRLSSLEVVLPATDGANWTPLATLGEFVLQPSTSQITRFDGIRTNTVQAWVAAGTLPAVALDDLNARLVAADFQLPPGVSLAIGGEASERNEAVGNLAASAAILMVLMAATLVLSFNSFRLAGVIGAVAFASVGLAMGALWIFDYPFGFMAIVGTMGLVGVAINDSIVVLSAIQQDEQARTGDADAIRAVVHESTRHILATTATTVVGFLPLFLGGGGFWPPVAVTIGGGVIGATLLALVFVPGAYRLLACPKLAARAKGGSLTSDTEPALTAVPSH